MYKIGNETTTSLTKAKELSAEAGVAYKVRYVPLKDEGLLNPIPDKRR
jgi:hypothetical protein